MSTSLITVYVENLNSAKAIVAAHNLRVAKLNKRHGQDIAPATIENKGTRFVAQSTTDKGGNISTRDVVLVDLELTVEPAVILGWQICAVFSLTDAGYLASRVVGTTAAELSAYTTRASDCDHCRAKRARNTTYVLRNTASKEEKLVGSTCVRDFTGHADPRALISYADMLSGLEEELGDLDNESSDRESGARRAGSAVRLVRYLGFVRMAIKSDGWLSRSQARDRGGMPTSDRAWDLIEKFLDAEKAAQLLQNSDAPERDGQSGEVMVEFARLQDIAKPSDEQVAMAASDLAVVEEHLAVKAIHDDFEEKIAFIVNQGYAFRQNIGMAAAICRMADRIRSDKQALQSPQLDEWMGTESKREVFKLTCVYKTVTEGDWGASTFHIFVDAEGRRATWSSSSESLKIGAAYDLKGTVKRHELYKGKKSTSLSRCKVVKEHGEAEAVTAG